MRVEKEDDEEKKLGERELGRGVELMQERQIQRL